MRHRKYFRASPLDVRAAGYPVWVAFGPVRAPTADEIATTIAGMARLGTKYRVGLIPSTTSRVWRVDSSVLDRKFPRKITSADDALDGIINSAIELDGIPSSSIGAQGVRDEFICVYIDHGVGDAYIMLEVVAALSQASRGTGFVHPRPIANTNSPFLWAFISTMSSPAGLIAGVRSVRTKRSSRQLEMRPESAAKVTLAGAQKPLVPRFVFERSEANLVPRVQDWRRHTGVRTSMATMVMVSICRALRTAGIEFGDDVEVVTDLRRYLPANRSTLSNFVSVVNVECPTTATPQQFAAALAAEVDSLAPLVKSLGSLAILFVSRGLVRLNRVVTGRGSSDTPNVPNMAGQRVIVSFSDLTRLPMSTRVQWLRPDDAQLAVMLPLGSPAHLSITLSVLGAGEIQASATFSADRIDEHKVRGALKMGLTSTNLLPGPV